MSIISIPKQLPTDHLIEYRFKAYEKASSQIKHMNNVYDIIQLGEYHDNCPMLNKRFKRKLPETPTNKISYSPTIKKDSELAEKINNAYSFYKIGAKQTRKLKKNLSYQSNHSRPKVVEEFKKNKYKIMIDKTLKEFNRIKKSELVLEKKIVNVISSTKANRLKRENQTISEIPEPDLYFNMTNLRKKNNNSNIKFRDLSEKNRITRLANKSKDEQWDLEDLLHVNHLISNN